MTLKTGLFTGLNVGLKSSTLSKYGATRLVNLDFSTPVLQSFGSSSATHQYLLTETSGNYADTGTGTTYDIDTFVAGQQGQTAPGIWDGSSYVATNAWETVTAASTAAVSNGAVFDSNNTDLYFRMFFRMTTTPATGKRVVSKRTGTAAGCDIVFNSNGTITVTIEDESNNSVSAIVSGGPYGTGALHYLELFYDVSEDELTVNTDLDNGNAATDTSAVVGTLTTSAFFFLGNASGHANLQFIAAEGAEGAAAATMFAETFWTHATDPTGKITTQTRASLISVPASATEIAHFYNNTLPITYDAGYSDTNKLALYCNTAVTNLLTYSEELTNWTSSNMTEADNASNSPDGFKSASSLTATATNGYSALTFTTVAATVYTLSVWVLESTVGATGRLIFYNETGTAELASQVFTTTSSWQQVTVVATTSGGQVSSSIRVEVDTNTEVIFAWGAMATIHSGVGPYIRTSGSTAALAGSDYTAAGDYTRTQGGEVSATFIPTIDSGAIIHTVWDNDSSFNDQRYLYLDSADRVASNMRGGATTEDSKHTGVPVTFGVERNVRYLWDVEKSTLGFETLLVDAGTTYEGAALPYDQTHGTGFTDINIGVRYNTTFQLDGSIQLIQAFDSKNGKTP